MPRIAQASWRAAENAIIESNSILRFLQPDVFVSVLDAGTMDFKESAKRYLDRADAVVLTGGELDRAVWQGISLRLVAGARQFHGGTDKYCSNDLVDFVRSRVAGLNERGSDRSEPPLPRPAGI